MYRDPGAELILEKITTRAELVHTRPAWRQFSWMQRTAKRAMDILGALMFFTLGLPIFLGVAAGVAVTSRGPIFYKQRRIGRFGRSFVFIKFRSMVVDSDRALARHLETHPVAREQWDKFQKLDRDPRITHFGEFLRRTSLDELPQFWNVLIGDMSLVGPRPCMQRQAQLYGKHWPDYCSLRPGLTGLWQVSGRNRLTFDERVALDVQYARRWSLKQDLRILMQTVRVVVSGDGSR